MFTLFRVLLLHKTRLHIVCSFQGRIHGALKSFSSSNTEVQLELNFSPTRPATDAGEGAKSKVINMMSN